MAGRFVCEMRRKKSDANEVFGLSPCDRPIATILNRDSPLPGASAKGHACVLFEFGRLIA
jgi:hypothetical protein